MENWDRKKTNGQPEDPVLTLWILTSWCGLKQLQEWSVQTGSGFSAWVPVKSTSWSTWTSGISSVPTCERHQRIFPGMLPPTLLFSDLSLFSVFLINLFLTNCTTKFMFQRLEKILFPFPGILSITNSTTIALSHQATLNVILKVDKSYSFWYLLE